MRTENRHPESGMENVCAALSLLADLRRPCDMVNLLPPFMP
jgi:hypothetical protein